MDVVELRNIVSRIKSSLFKNSNFYSIGVLKSHFKGSGLKFKEHQVYNHGDDVRFIDWKILAKTSEPYIRTYDEERNIEIAVLIDAGPTMFTGFEGKSKLQVAVELCCLLYLIAAETKDYIHAVITYDEVINLPKLNGEKGIARLFSVLEEQGIVNDKGEFITEGIRHNKSQEITKNILRHLKKKREVVVFSDFNNALNWDTLKRFSSYSNLHNFRVTSPLDRAIKTPYRFLLNGGGLFSSFNEIKFKDEKEEKKKKNRYYELKVEDRYLEDFIKNMI